MKCNYCKKEGDVSYCTKCMKTGYCSRECQVSDWSQVEDKQIFKKIILDHKLTCGKAIIAKPSLVEEDQRLIVKVLRKHFINIYRYIYALDQKEADSFKDRNTYYYNKKHEHDKDKKCSHKHSHSAALANTENKSSSGQCCTSFFAKIYIPEDKLSHLERSARETLAKHKLPFILPELLDFIGKKFFKLKQDGIKDGLAWDKQTQSYLAGECLKGGCQQFFINKIKEYSLKDQRIDSKQPLLLANAATWRTNNPKTPLNFLTKETINEVMVKGFTSIKNYIEDDKILPLLFKELNFLEMDGRFDESVQESSIRTDRNLWISLSEISAKDFPNLRKVCWQLSSLPYELADKAQICVQISELFQISYFKGNGSFQTSHYDSAFDGDQDNGRKLTCLLFCNLDDSIDCRNQGKLKIFTKVYEDKSKPNEFIELETQSNTVVIFKSRVLPYEFLPNHSESKRFVVRFWITGPIEQNKAF